VRLASRSRELEMAVGVMLDSVEPWAVSHDLARPFHPQFPNADRSARKRCATTEISLECSLTPISMRVPMFVNAVEHASKFTQPVIVSRRFADGSVECSCATFIIVNDSGWILTAAHVVTMLQEFQQHQTEIAKHEAQREAILNDSKLNVKQKRKQIDRLGANARWVTNISYLWALPGLGATGIQNFQVDQFADLATGQLEPFDPKSIKAYPTFKATINQLPVGQFLCRLGFPFHDVHATYDETTNKFSLAPGVFPMPWFPLEGMHTRDAIFIDEKTGREAKFLETSTPGLRGQSGGPIFDSEGKIWAMQSRTLHFPLGFSPKIKHGNREIEEHQFLNVGVGTHIEEIAKFLKAQGVGFKTDEN
jgi:hypothetical protein